jgi:AraC family transcriptional regulator
MAEVAAAAGVHPVHLARVFRKQFGMTVGEYQRRLRLAWAGKELLRGDTDLATLALEAGFADQSHFTRAFRWMTGMTPGELRRVAC